MREVSIFKFQVSSGNTLLIDAFAGKSLRKRKKRRAISPAFAKG
jgi:hypothetical protein